MIHINDLTKISFPDHWRIRQLQWAQPSSFHYDTAHRVHLELHRYWVEPQVATFQAFTDDPAPLVTRHQVEQSAELVLNFNWDGEISEREFEAEFTRQVHSKFNPEKIPVPEVRKVSGVVRLWRLWRHREGELYALARHSKWELNSQGFVSCDEEPKLSTEHQARHYMMGSNRYYGMWQSVFGGTSGSGFHGFYEISEMAAQEEELCDMALSGHLSPPNVSMRITVDNVTREIPAPQYSYIMGSYLAWGKMVRGTKGMRASHAKPEYLILPTDPDYSIEMMTLADKYGMKPVTLDEAWQLPTGILEGKTWRE